MDKTELIQHWNYFCSLAERLDETKHYIDHGLIEHDGKIELVHGKVYSDVFKQIIVLAASEFEIMSKALCALHGQQVKQIVDISDAILNQYPKIITFEVSTPFWINTPLQEWRVSVVNNGNNRKVQGLDWWFAYNAKWLANPDYNGDVYRRFNSEDAGLFFDQKKLNKLLFDFSGGNSDLWRKVWAMDKCYRRNY